MNPTPTMETILTPSQSKALKGAIAIGIFILILILNPFVKIDASERGLVLNWGAIQDKVLHQGLHFRIPLVQKVEKVSIQTQQIDYEVPVGASGAITKDNQTIGAHLTLFYRYDEERLIEVRKDWGFSKLHNQVQTNLNESFKEVIGEYTIFDVATKQEEIRGKVFEHFNKKAEHYPVIVSELRVQNYDWSDAFDAQINETMSRAQQVKQAEQSLLLTEQEAQKKVKQAEADKAALVTQAEGEKAAAQLRADAKALEGAGIQKYNQAVQANMELEIRLRQLEIEKLKAEKWNGAYVPNNNYLPIPYNYGSAQGQ